MTPSLSDEYLDRLDPAARARELAELHRLAHDPLKGLGSGIPTPTVDIGRAAA